MRECAALFAALFIAQTTAHAHGRAPNVEALAFDRSDPDRIFVQFSYGLLVSEDGGATWRFVCSPAYGADPNIEDPPFAIADDGGIVVGTFDGLVRGEPEMCSWSAAPGTGSDTYVTHLTFDPTLPNALWASTARLPDPDLLQRSTDGGRTFAPWGEPITAMLVEHITPARSDPDRLYLSGYVRPTATTPRHGYVMRSDDGGLTFDTIEIPLEVDEQMPIVGAVDPTNADRIFVRMRRTDIDRTPERLLYSDDGGQSFMEVLRLVAIRGIAISDDGRTVWAGSGGFDGLWAARNGSLTFTEVNPIMVRCLEARGNELWICANPYTSRFAVGRSVDGGTTIEPMLWLDDVTELPPCATCTAMHILCEDFLDDLIYDIDRFLGSMTLPMPPPVDGGLLELCSQDGAVLPIDAGPPPPDAGAVTDAGADAGDTIVPGGGCGCRASSGGGGASIFALFVALLSMGARRKNVALLVALAILIAAPTARAHGRPTAIHHVAFDPDDPDRIVLQTTFGLAVSDDAGASWRWICAAMYGTDPTIEDPDVVAVPGGALVLSTFSGAVRTDLCDATASEGPVANAFVVDLAADPVAPGVVWGATSSGVVPDLVVRSDDGGATFVQVGAPIPEVLLERIAISPSMPSRMYASGAIPESATDPRRAIVLRSDDAGDMFTELETPLLDGERFPHVLAVDPTNPDRIFVRMTRAPIDGRPERLLISTNAGATFDPLFELPSLRGFAISDDGQTLWAGSALGGLWIARSGATTFEQIGAQHVLCVETRGAELWLCLDQIGDGFALGRSMDEGTTVDDMLHLDDVTELESCERCAGTTIVCPAWMPDLLSDYETYFGGGDGGVTGLPRDSAIPEECGGPPPPPPGCGCRAATRGMDRAWLFLLAVPAMLRRRR